MRAAAVIATCLALALPGAAAAQFGVPPDPSPAEPTVTQQPQAPTRVQDDGLESWQQLLIGLAGFVLLGGIAWAIVRDARQAAPADGRGAPAEGEREKGSRTPQRRRTARGRAKAKQARRARKKNRPA
jgi:hypothetical protein